MKKTKLIVKNKKEVLREERAVGTSRVFLKEFKCGTFQDSASRLFNRMYKTQVRGHCFTNT